MTEPCPARFAGRRAGSRRRPGGIIGTLVGAAAAGVAAGVAAERLLLKRRRRGHRPDPYRDEPFGELTADEYRTVTTTRASRCTSRSTAIRRRR